MPRRAVRLLVVPAILFLVVSGAVFAFAQWHPAKREAESSTVITGPRDATRGEALFAEKCATCHGPRGEGGGVGPALAGSELTLSQARTRILNGGGVMPPALVQGQDLEDVLAYLQLVFAS
jgi:mono/diheme cytochrome c family protein